MGRDLLEKSAKNKPPLSGAYYMTDNSDFQFHFSEHTTVVTCKKPTHILAGNYSHLNYEFFVAITDIDGLTIEGQPLSIPAGMVCPILSCQPHGALHLMNIISMTES